MRYTLLFYFTVSALHAQTFVVVSDTANGIVNPLNWTSNQRYVGAAWIDFDGDHDLDLATGRNELYRNDGNGRFVKVSGAFGSSASTQGEVGMTWADFDNDGDLDVYLVGLRSDLYRNDNGTFNRVTTGTIGLGQNYNAWAGAWGDYDNDGHVDLVLAAPFGFNGITTTNFLFHNNGDGTFAKVDTTPITSQTAPFTVPSWSDYDLDGDIDLFIGSGPANGTIAADFYYKNMLTESGTAFFIRMTDNFAVEPRDGQNVNWIDYDNDGDLDMYVSNYVGNTSGLVNHMYRNDGGTYTKITSGAIVSDAQSSLGNIWEDFDNDGDLDCFVTNEQGSTNRYYRNDGGGAFTRIDGTPLSVDNTPHNGASAGDFDNDGDLDIFAWSTPASFRRLYRNDLASDNHWIRFELQGTVSNRASLGATVRVKAVIGGVPIWQMRHISAQNAFNGHSSLFPHFGLGDATLVDSVIVTWPSGTTKISTQVDADQFIVLTEDGASTAAPVFLPQPAKNTFATLLFSLSLRAGAIPSAAYRLLNPIGDAVIDSVTGLFTWTPSLGDIGNKTFNVVAVNSAGSDTLALNVTVLDFQKPVVEGKPDRVMFAGTVYKDTVRATAIPVARFYPLSVPAGMTVDSVTGILQWTASAGTVSIDIIAQNSGGRDTLSYSVHADPAPVLSVLQNPGLPKYADLVLTAENNVAADPSVRVNGAAQGTMTPVAASSRVFKHALQFAQTADFTIAADVFSAGGYLVQLTKLFSAVVVNPESGGELKRPGLWTLVFDPRTFFTETAVIIELDTSGNEPTLRISGPRPMEKPVHWILDGHVRVYAEGSDVPLIAEQSGGRTTVELVQYGTYTLRAGSSPRDENRAVPKGIALYSNFPNPFNPVTTIRYSLDRDEKIELAVYNLLGQRVRTLFSGLQTTGFHVGQWDGTNEIGHAVTSGIYVVRLRFPGGLVSRKISMIK